MELPRGAKHADYSHGRNAGAMLPDVQRTLRLGHDREPQIRARSAERDEEVVPAALLLHSESHRGLLLQRRPCDQVDVQAGDAWVPGRYELERRLRRIA